MFQGCTRFLPNARGPAEGCALPFRRPRAAAGVWRPPAAARAGERSRSGQAAGVKQGSASPRHAAPPAPLHLTRLVMHWTSGPRARIASHSRHTSSPSIGLAAGGGGRAPQKPAAQRGAAARLAAAAAATGRGGERRAAGPGSLQPVWHDRRGPVTLIMIEQREKPCDSSHPRSHRCLAAAHRSPPPQIERYRQRPGQPSAIDGRRCAPSG